MITIKELAHYCNQLCEEGKGEKEVSVRFNFNHEDMSVADYILDEDKLVITLDDNKEDLCSSYCDDMTFSQMQDIISRHDDYCSIEEWCFASHCRDLGDDEKAQLIKQWMNELL